MKYIEEYLKDVIKVKPLGELTTKDDELNGMSGDMVYIDGKYSDIFISHADYANWLERKYEQKSIDNLTPQEAMDIAVAKCFDEQKPTDKTKPKFEVGDWILYSGDHYEGVRHITKIDEKGYYIERNGLPHGIIPFNHEICIRLWTIQDAKDGDVLNIKGAPFIYKNHDKDYVYLYCGVNLSNEFVEAKKIDSWNNNNKVYPATKEQRDTLFAKMRKAGYMWNAEKKELEKTHVIDEGKAEMDYCFTKMMNGEKVSSNWSEEDEDYYDAIIAKLEVTQDDAALTDNQMEFLKSLKQRHTWRPTKEQIATIEYIIKAYESTTIHLYDGAAKQLYSLLEQLKKL